MLDHSTARDSAFARLHPLIKIAILVTTAVSVFFLSDITVLALGLCVIVLGIRFFGIEFGRALLVVKLYILSLPMLLALFVLSYLWHEPTYMDGVMRGLGEGTLYALRFLDLILVNFAVVLTTDSREIIASLRALRFPPVLSQILAHVISLMPRLVEELQAVVEAQRVRGMTLARMWRPDNWIPLVLPVIIAAMRYSEQTAISLELRGGHGGEEETLPPMRVTDWAVGLVCVVVTVICVIVYKNNGGANL